MKIKTNDLKSGARIRLRNGWYATIKDNKRGNVRTAEVEGLYTEIGSVYSHDIVLALVDGVWVEVEHTPSQLKCRQMTEDLFGG